MMQIKTFISTKAGYLDEKVNKWLEEHPDIKVTSITPYISYTSIKDQGVYMIGCTIVYTE